MKIIYKPNPLCTVIELDEREKKELWYKIKLEEMQDLLFSAHFHLTYPGRIDLERVKQDVDPKYYMSDEGQSGLDKRVEELFSYYMGDLNGPHVGDCTCVPCSCSKCHLESLLGIDTIKGLRKHEASKIDAAFGKNNERTIDEAITSLENYNPSAEWAGYEAHIPRWKEEAVRALAWLKNYRDTYFKGE